MRIATANAWLERLPLTKPYTIAYHTFCDVEIVFFEIVLENGITGLGSASPSEEVVGETPAQTAQNLQNDFVSAISGRDIRHINQLIDEARLMFPHLPGTLAAIDMALHDAFCKYLGIAVVDFYGRKIEALPTSVTIGIKETAAMLEEAAQYFAGGFRILKIKTGMNVEEDVERVSRLFERFGHSMLIRVDANTGYTIAQLKQFFALTSQFSIELVEQPLKPGQEAALAQLTPDQRACLAADESLLGPETALALCHHPTPYGIFNIKLMKCGGIGAARQIAGMAAHAGIRLFWGCNDESRASIAAALHAAYSCANTRYLDLDGCFDLSRDFVTGGFVMKEGYMYLGDTPGLGVQTSGKH